MEQQTTNQQSEQQIQWYTLISKSLRKNRQLDFVNNISISFLDESKLPCNEMIQYGEIFENKALVSPMDKRCKAFQSIKNNKFVELLWYFPISKEKFNIKCELCIKGNDIDSFQEENSQQFYQQYWDNKIEKEERKTYHNAHPDTQTIEKQILNKELSELDKYNSQDKNQISQNFTLLVFYPYEVEHTVFAPPQVIADSRKPKFESVFQPYKRDRKYLHRLDKESKEWKIVPINP